MRFSLQALAVASEGRLAWPANTGVTGKLDSI
jgi:hypothetical protein